MFHLAYINLKRTKIRSILTGMTIVIGISSLFLILSLNAGLKEAVFHDAERRSPLNQITVHPPTSTNIFNSIFDSGTKRLNDPILNEIKAIPHVSTIYPETSYLDPSSLEMSILGQRVQTDSMVFGVPYEFIGEDIPDKKEWENPSEPFPVIISRKLLDIYNLSIALPKDLPQISEDMIINRKMDIYLGYSSFFAPFTEKEEATRIKARIVGFSDKTSLIGITLPINVVETLNRQKKPDYQNEYLKAYVIIDSPQYIEEISAKVEKMGLQTSYLQKEYEQIQNSFNYLTLGLAIISIIIICVSALSIANSFFANINERINEIGIMRSIGATKIAIQFLFLIEAGILGIINGIIGVAVGIILTPFINSAALNLIPEISNKPDSIFAINIELILLLPLFATIYSLLSAYLPAKTAARLNPIESLAK